MKDGKIDEEGDKDKINEIFTSSSTDKSKYPESPVQMNKSLAIGSSKVVAVPPSIVTNQAKQSGVKEWRSLLFSWKSLVYGLTVIYFVMSCGLVNILCYRFIILYLY